MSSLLPFHLLILSSRLQKYEERINIDRRTYELLSQYKKRFSAPKNLISQKPINATDYRVYETCAFCKIALGHDVMYRDNNLQKELRYKPNSK